MLNLQSLPFHLTDNDITWVNDTYNSMSLDEKIGQLFCPIVFTDDETELKSLVQQKHIGGVLYREGPAKEIRKNHLILQSNAKIPLFIASNLEKGGNGSVIEGTYFGTQMLVAATNKMDNAFKMGKVSAKEGKSIGVNLNFGPVVDIDLNFRNPITNVRTFGSDVELVKNMSMAYMNSMLEESVIPTLKHFPGDGIDERDQHLLTSVNTMECETWDETFGAIYKALIEEGALSIMAGHIALPKYEERFDKTPCQKVIPASLSKNLLENLLRKQLKFNGLIVTDSSAMVGFTTAMKRELAVPLTIENGCDVLLFNKNLEEDLRFMKDGYKNGILSEKRLEEAVLRILATKASIKLHERKKENILIPDISALKVLQNKSHISWARATADEGITLVKDTTKLLPLNPNITQRILLQIIGNNESNHSVLSQVKQKFLSEGFNVSYYTNEALGCQFSTVTNFKKEYDLVLYIGNVKTISNKTVARIDWHTQFGQGNNVPWFVKEVPTLFISFGNPYHLIDVPMISCYVNAYCNSSDVISATIDKIMGRSLFKGINPIDPFCGYWDTTL